MSRPRSQERKNFPEGLYFEKQRKIYLFKRIDGSRKSLGKDFKRAKKMALSYNLSYRLNPNLVHKIEKDKPDVFEQKRLYISAPISEHFPQLFEEICRDKKWGASTINNKRQMYNNIYTYFKEMRFKDITSIKVTECLDSIKSSMSPNVRNRYVDLLQTMFAYALDKDLIECNPAANKIKKTVVSKKAEDRVRLTLDDFRKIHAVAGNKGYFWLQNAMELALQLSQAVSDVSKLKYEHIFDDKVVVQRTKSKVGTKIPVNTELQRIIDNSKDGVKSPFIVHLERSQRYKGRKLGKGIEHPTQVQTNKISREFSKIRDELHLYTHIKDRNDRPQFHDIRSLAIFLFTKQFEQENKSDSLKKAGIRAAQKSEQSTKLYIDGHENFRVADDAVIDWRNS